MDLYRNFTSHTTFVADTRIAHNLLSGLLVLWLSLPASAKAANWLGGVDRDWHNPANWSTTTLPDAAEDVTIPNNGDNYCLLAGAAGSCKSLSIQLTGSPNRNRLDLETTLTVAGNVNLLGNAKLNISPGGVLLVGGSLNAGGLNSVSSATTTQLGDVTVTGSLGIGSGNRDIALYYANGGNLTVSQNLTLATAQKDRIGGGALTIDGATVTIGGNLVNGYGGGATGIGAKGTVNLLSGVLQVDGQLQNAAPSIGLGEVYGTMTVAGGELTVAGNFVNGVNSSEERNERTFPLLLVSGNTALFNVGGNYLTPPNAVLVAELAAATHTPINVAGDITLDGTLKVTTAANYRPRGGERWQLMVADADNDQNGTFSGFFHTIDFSEVDQYGNWKVKITAAGVLELYLPRNSTLLYIR